MDLLEDLKMSFLNFSFVMIYIIYKMLLLLKNDLKFFKGGILECFFKGAAKLNFMLYSHVVIIYLERVYISLHFLPILFVKLGFRVSVFLLFMFLFLRFLVFIISVLRFKFNIISKNLTTFFNFVLTLFNDLLKCKNRVKKTNFQRDLFLKKNAILKKKIYSVHLSRKIWSCHKFRINWRF